MTPQDLALIAAKPVLTPHEVSVLAGISIGTLYKQWKQGTGPDSFHIGRSRKVRKVALERWLSALGKKDTV